MSPIQDFKMSYEILNKEEIFSEGDIVAGTVTFTLTEETKVKSLLVKVKGDANVHWTEGYGIHERRYDAQRRYLKVKEYLVAEKPEGTVLTHGAHRYNFRLKIPQGEIPSSFKGKFGKIVYKLEAKMPRSWHLPSTISEKLNFVSKSLSHRGQVRRRQTGSTDKEPVVFSKGHVKMSVTVDRKVCSPGDTLSVVAKIHNSSSRKVQPKVSLHQKIMYHAEGATKSSVKSLCTMTWATVASNSEKTVTCHMEIPGDVIYSLLNCGIISVDYYLKVFLDVTLSFDPEVRFPLVIVPSLAMGPYPPGAVGAPSYSDFPPPAFPTGSYGVPTAPGAYGYPAPGPTQPGNTASGYNNQSPQQAPPYSFPAAAFSPPSVQHQGPPLFLPDPPAYTSLYPPVPDTFGSNGSDKKPDLQKEHQ
ncbi:arrestin domain-containing protein 3-like [Pagrus major]|uniref:arrestin domain-containing protein 3-like n=1 Tax=Pagrus major TaxID=143350 RepID=UPI003CC8AF9E